MTLADTETFLYESDRLKFRELRRSDIAGPYFHWFNDQQVCRHSRHGIFPATIEKMNVYIDTLECEDSEFVWVMIDKDRNAHIGNIALQNISTMHRSASLSIIIGDKDCWGKGYALEASRVLLNHCFSKLELHRVSCETSEHNTSMIKLAGSLGMHQEGCRRKTFFDNGRHVDLVEFGILDHEFDLDAR